MISTPFFWRSGNQVRMEKSHLQAFSANGILCVLPVCVWITAVTESSPLKTLPYYIRFLKCGLISRI